MLDRLSNIINFRKTASWFVFALISTGLIFCIILYSMFQEKITIAVDCLEIRSNASLGGPTEMSLKLLSDLSDKSDVTGVYVLNQSNMIIHKEPNSPLNVNKTLNFSKSSLFDDSFTVNGDEMNLLTPINTEGIMRVSIDEYYPENLPIGYILSKDNDNVKHNFFRIFETKSKNKILITLDIKPVKNGKFVVHLIFAFYAIAFAFYWTLLSIWSYRKAKNNNLNPLAWTLITMITNVIGVISLILLIKSLKNNE